MAGGPVITIRVNDLYALMRETTDHRIKEFEVAVIRSEGRLVLSWQVQGNRILPLHAGEPLRPTIFDPTDNRRRIPDPDEGKVITPEVKENSECAHFADCKEWGLLPCEGCENNETWCDEFERRKAAAEKPKAPKPVPAPKPTK